MKETNLRFALASSAFVLSSCWTLPVQAQSTATEEPVVEDAASGALADIVVTASRRVERLQDVPIAVSALSPETLTDAGVTSTAQLPQVVPGLTFSRSNGNMQMNLRGVSSRSVLMGDEPNIATYIDGVYQATPYSAVFDLIEVERIEVLRGPQGTLFGRNSTGGLINVITPDPSFDWKGNITARAGSFDEVSLRGYVSGPISDKIAFDVSGLFYDDGGYVRNLVNGGRVGERTTYAGRAKLLLAPSDAFRSTVTVGFLDGDDRSGSTYQPLARNTVGIRTPGAIVPTVPNTAALNNFGFFKNKGFNASLKNTIDADFAEIETITSYQRNKLLYVADLDGTTANAQSALTGQRDVVATQEIRLLSSSTSRLRWTAGVFGFLGTGRYSPFTIYGASGVTSLNLTSRNHTKAWAVYAEGVYPIVEGLELTAGGRYSWERRHYTVNRTVPVTAPLDTAATFKKFTPRIALTFKPNTDLTIYASYSQGFKSGLFSSASVDPVPTRPEYLDAYEAGIKADPLPWLRTNLALFYYSYTDIQAQARDGAVSRLTNAAKARMQGGELEVTMTPARGFDLRMSGAYLDTKVNDFPNASTSVPLPNGGNSTVIVANLRGSRLIRSPKFTFNMGASYATDVSFGRLGASANYFHSSKFFWDFQNRLHQKAYSLANAQLWVEPTENLRLSLWIDNLTDAAVTAYANATPTGDTATYVRPRSWGGAARFSF